MKIENLHIGYTKTLLEINSLELITGQVYALVGANGRGKTTLLQTLIGNIPALSGEIYIRNKKLNELSPTEKAKTFGFVKSRFDGVAYMRAHEYVALGRSPYTNAFGRLSASDNEIVDECLKLMEVAHLSKKFTTELSDGERQMLAIAKVLAQETDYIFLDEPTAFLDYSNKKKVLELLVKIAKEQKKCVLFSSHDLEMVLEFTDGIIYVPKSLIELGFSHKKDMPLSVLISTAFER